MSEPALIVVDVQRAFDDPSWGRRNNPAYEANSATHAFDRPDPFGGVVSADELVRVTATNLHEEFATVIDTAAALSDGGS